MSSGQALREIDTDLTARIRVSCGQASSAFDSSLTGNFRSYPPDVRSHLEQLTPLGFTQRWVALQNDLWILVFATHPDTAITLFREQAQILADSALCQIFLDDDRAHDLDPHDPRIDDLACRSSMPPESDTEPMTCPDTTPTPRSPH
jgi:hypothetical protein